MKWNVLITDFLGGFAPAWYKETYPSYGNKNHAGAMTNIDLTNAGFLTQGPGLSNLTNGTEAAAVSTLINSILDQNTASDVTYGVGGAKLYKLSSTAVTSDGTWPHTIDKATVTAEDGEDVCLYQGNLYYSYNHSSTAGDIGSYDLSSTFDDDWASTAPSGASALVGDVPHQMIVGDGDVMYIANGRYLASWDGTTFQPQALDLPTGTVIQSIASLNGKVWMLANRPDTTGSNKNTASIYIWDGTTNSWETEISLMGTAGACHVKNGTFFLFYRDVSSSGGYKLAYVRDGNVVDVANYTGALPTYSQVTDFEDFLIWVSSELIFAYGAGDKDLPVRLFQLADGGYTTVGALACPFGTPVVASTQSTSYKLAKFANYDTTSSWKSIMFDVTGDTGISRLHSVTIIYEALTSGARCDWKLLDSQGRTIVSEVISYTKAALGEKQVTLTRAHYPLSGKVTEDFRVELDFANGSTTAPVKVKAIKIYGSSHE